MIHVGGCIEWLETFADKSVDVTIADPPYSEHVHAKSVTTKGQNEARKRSDPLKRVIDFEPLTPALRRDFAIEVARVTKRWALIFSDEENIGAWRWDLRAAGLEVIRVCPWIKPNAAPQMTGDRPGAAWEPIVVAHRAHPNGKPLEKHWNGGGHKGYFVHNLPHASERVHETEKPVSLMLELVELFSDRGELVIDPFCGSGSTGVACIRLGRRFMGAELKPETAETARHRLVAEREGHSLAAHEAKQETLFSTSVVPARAEPTWEPSPEVPLLRMKPDTRSQRWREAEARCGPHGGAPEDLEIVAEEQARWDSEHADTDFSGFELDDMP